MCTGDEIRKLRNNVEISLGVFISVDFAFSAF